MLFVLLPVSFTVVSSVRTSSGAVADGFSDKSLVSASALVLGGLGLTSIAFAATVLPAQTIALCGVAGGLTYAGHRHSKGEPLPQIAGSAITATLAGAVLLSACASAPVSGPLAGLAGAAMLYAGSPKS